MPSKFIYSFISLLLVFSGTTATAQDVSVFGLQLGAAVSIPECKRDDYGYALTNSNICYQRTPVFGLFDEKKYDKKSPRPPLGTEVISINYPFTDRPQIVSGGIEAFIINSKLEGINFHTNGLSNAELVLEKLKEKYGPPKAVLPEKRQTRYGASFNAFTAVWEMPNLSVLFQSVYGSVESGRVTIGTNKGIEWFSEQLAKSSRDNHPL